MAARAAAAAAGVAATAAGVGVAVVVHQTRVYWHSESRGRPGSHHAEAGPRQDLDKLNPQPRIEMRLAELCHGRAEAGPLGRKHRETDAEVTA